MKQTVCYYRQFPAQRAGKGAHEYAQGIGTGAGTFTEVLGKRAGRFIRARGIIAAGEGY